MRTADGQPLEHESLTGIVFLPDAAGALLWDKSGTIYHYRQDGTAFVMLGATQLQEVYDAGDCGLISIALDPDWPYNGYVYAAHCISESHSIVRRYVFRGDLKALQSSGTTVIELGDRSASRPWHNVGSIGFFPNDPRSMWILAGEKALPEHAQVLSDNLGAVLRIIPSRDPAVGGYEPHPDNPFGGSDLTSSPDLYAWGLRSPWRGSVDATGRIWIGDVGDEVEEINLVAAAGANFGWSTMQGPCRDPHCATFRDPVTYWTRESDHRYRADDPHATPSTLRAAWVGVPYARGEVDPYEGYLDNAILFSDMCIGYVRALSVDTVGTVVRDDHVGHLAGLSGAAEGPDRHLYVTSYGGCTSDVGAGSGLFRVLPHFGRPETQTAVETSSRPLLEDPLGPMPPKLSATGVFADLQQRQPIAQAVKYEPAHPLWSNGSHKARWLVLPPGTHIDNTRREVWQYLPGTLFFKTFSYGDEPSLPIETRVIRRGLDGWEYYAYGWQDGDADLLTLKYSVDITVLLVDGTSFTHTIPSRFDCRSCHENGESPILGVSELQLSGQLLDLHRAGVFASPPPIDPAAIAHFDPKTRDVLGYLHGNCVHCHNETARAMTTLDLRHDHALASLIGVPTVGSGQAAGIRVLPGLPEQSILYLSLAAPESVPELRPMPPLGVQRRDDATIELIRSWIAELSP